MRYSLILVILCLLALALPSERYKEAKDAPAPLVGMLVTPSQQERLLGYADGQLKGLLALPPQRQIMVLGMAFFLIVNAALLLSYLINSVAAITGLGVSCMVVFPLLALALLGLLFDWKKPRRHLQDYLRDHAEFGPLFSKMNSRAWKKRFNRAAREHGFASEY